MEASGHIIQYCSQRYMTPDAALLWTSMHMARTASIQLQCTAIHRHGLSQQQRHVPPCIWQQQWAYRYNAQLPKARVTSTTTPCSTIWSNRSGSNGSPTFSVLAPPGAVALVVTITVLLSAAYLTCSTTKRRHHRSTPSAASNSPCMQCISTLRMASWTGAPQQRRCHTAKSI